MISLLDAQWLLRRNFYAIKSHAYPSYNQLISSFLSSVCNICEECGGFDVFLVWDKGPYMKESYLTLKTTRYYARESDVVEIPPDVSEEERKKLEETNKWILEQAAMESEFRHAKNFLLKMSRGFGLPSVFYSGYEADDLAYIIANELGIKTDIKFLTKDSDWINLMGPTTEFVRLTKNKEYYSYKNTEVGKVPLLIKGILASLIEGNHNDIEVLNLGVSLKEALNIYENSGWNEGDWMFATNHDKDSVHKFIERAKALDPRTFLTDEIKSSLLTQLQVQTPIIDGNSLSDLCKKTGIRCNFWKILNLNSRRRKTLNLFEETVIKFPEI